MKRRWREALGVLALIGALGFTACTVVNVEDVEVNWTIDDVEDQADCAVFGIDSFDVELVGVDNRIATIYCDDDWHVIFPDVEEGPNYTATVTAYDANDVQIGESKGTSFDVDGSGSTVEIVGLNFTTADLTGGGCGDSVCDSSESCDDCPEDCGQCGGAKIDVLWNINGTVDGSDTGQSWDTCAEVGATEVVLTVDGTAQTFGCSASGNMSTTLTGLEEDRGYLLGLKLVDASGTDLTTEVEATVAASTAGGLFIGDFMYDSFYEPNLTGIEGQYHFQSTYDTLKCSETTPVVDYTVTLVRTEDNVAVTDVQICDLGNTGCEEADGAAAKPCTDLEQVLSMLPWGSYVIKLEGGSGTDIDLEICWEYEGNILIGAGADNPLDQINLDGINGASCFL